VTAAGTDVSRRALVFRRAWRGFLRYRGYDAAAALTFFSCLTALPAALLAVTTVALLESRSRALDDLAAIVSTFAPGSRDSIRDALAELLALDNRGLALLIGLVLTIWTTSGYAAAFGRAVDTVYGAQEGRTWPVFRAQMLAVAVIVVLLGAGIAAGLLLTPTASDDILSRRGVDPVVETVWNIGKWPVLAVLLILLIGVLYYFAPGVRFPRLRWLSLGSAIALTVWIVLTALFAVYVTLTGAYGHLYGRLGLLLAALIWVYLSNLALLVGIQLDAELLRLRQLEEGVAAEENVVLPLKHSERVLRLAQQRSGDIADAVAVRDAARARVDAQGDQGPADDPLSRRSVRGR
jgi:membrane protein